MRLRFQARLLPAQYHLYPSLSRYFDHIQFRPSVRKSAEALAPAFDVIRLDFSTAPPIERKAPEAKKKEKQSAATERDGTKSAANNGKATSAGTEDVGPPIPSMIDLSVGHIVDGTPVYCMQIATPFNALPVKKHPDADSLYVEASSHCVDRLLWL